MLASRPRLEPKPSASSASASAACRQGVQDHDTLCGEDGDDDIDAGMGNDWLSGGLGFNTCHGGVGIIDTAYFCQVTSGIP